MQGAESAPPRYDAKPARFALNQGSRKLCSGGVTCPGLIRCTGLCICIKKYLSTVPSQARPDLSRGRVLIFYMSYLFKNYNYSVYMWLSVAEA